MFRNHLISTSMLHIGDTVFMFPTAAAITAWLATSRAWRLALCWSLLFIFGIGLVTISKITFIGWGTAIPAIDFKTFSGHAMCVTAVFPVLFYLLLHRFRPFLRRCGIVVGLALGIAMSIALVALDEHTASEVLSGFLIGAGVSLGFISQAQGLPPLASGSLCLAATALTFAVVWLLHPATIGAWLFRLAKYLP